MRTYKEALDIILTYSRNFGTVTLPVSALLNGRVLAEDIFADRDYPPFNRSTMDGFALRSADLAAGITGFTIVEEIFAGSLSSKSLAAGECYKIMTGAVVPDSADLVIKKEEATGSGQQVAFGTTTVPGATAAPGVTAPPGTSKRPGFQNIARQGEDIRKGELYLQPGMRINSSVASALAVVGKMDVKVFSLPRVALFSSGDEIVTPDRLPERHQIRNSNMPMLASMLYDFGIVPRTTRLFPDIKQVIREGIEAALDNDLIILSGAVSAGDADFIPGTLKELGFQEIIYKVGLKPGKPVWFGMKPGGPVVFALPGNPLSTQVTFKLFIEPFLRRCFSMKQVVPLKVPILVKRIKRVPFDEFFPVTVQDEPYGLVPAVSHTSGDIRSATGSDGIAWHETGADELVPGDMIRYFPW